MPMPNYYTENQFVEQTATQLLTESLPRLLSGQINVEATETLIEEAIA